MSEKKQSFFPPKSKNGLSPVTFEVESIIIINTHEFNAHSTCLELSASIIHPYYHPMKRLFFKSPNLRSSNSHSVSRRRLRISDILLADEDHDAVESMDGVPETPMHVSPPSTKCYSPRRLVARLLAALRLTTKERRVLQRLGNEAGDSEMPSPSPSRNALRGNEEESGENLWLLAIGLTNYPNRLYLNFKRYLTAIAYV